MEIKRYFRGIKKTPQVLFYDRRNPLPKKWMLRDFSLGFPQSYLAGGRAHQKTVSFLIH